MKSVMLKKYFHYFFANYLFNYTPACLYYNFPYFFMIFCKYFLILIYFLVQKSARVQI